MSLAFRIPFVKLSLASINNSYASVNNPNSSYNKKTMETKMETEKAILGTMTMINVEFHMNEVIMPLIYIPDRKVRFHIYGEKIVARFSNSSPDFIKSEEILIPKDIAESAEILAKTEQEVEFLRTHFTSLNVVKQLLNKMENN